MDCKRKLNQSEEPTSKRAKKPIFKEETEELKLDTLPLELQQAIFGFVSCSNTKFDFVAIWTLRFVCRRWRLVIDDLMRRKPIASKFSMAHFLLFLEDARKKPLNIHRYQLDIKHDDFLIAQLRWTFSELIEESRWSDVATLYHEYKARNPDRIARRLNGSIQESLRSWKWPVGIDELILHLHEHGHDPLPNNTAVLMCGTGLPLLPDKELAEFLGSSNSTVDGHRRRDLIERLFNMGYIDTAILLVKQWDDQKFRTQLWALALQSCAHDALADRLVSEGIECFDLSEQIISDEVILFTLARVFGLAKLNLPNKPHVVSRLRARLDFLNK